MERIPVFSDVVASVGFDETAEVLEVEFSNGVVCQYLEVTVELFAVLMATGQFNEAYFAKEIKGKHKEHQVLQRIQ